MKWYNITLPLPKLVFDWGDYIRPAPELEPPTEYARHDTVVSLGVRPRGERLFEVRADGSVVDIGPWPPRDPYAWIDPFEGRE